MLFALLVRGGSMLHPAYSYPGNSAPSRGDTALCLVNFNSTLRTGVLAGAWGASLHYKLHSPVSSWAVFDSVQAHMARAFSQYVSESSAFLIGDRSGFALIYVAIAKIE